MKEYVEIMRLISYIGLAWTVELRKEADCCSADKLSLNTEQQRYSSDLYSWS
jgi:hypothetical protein